MNRFLKDMLMSKYGEDGRNPYGSRGGYVVSSRSRRDRDMEDYARGGRRDYGDDYARYDMRHSDFPYDGRGYDMARGNSQYGRQYNDGGRYDVDIRERGHYGDDYRMRDYARGGYGRDYGEEQYGKFSEHDIQTWKRDMENEDGTRGEHFSKEKVDAIAHQLGINPEEFGKATFCLAMNMEYSDYCKVAKKYGVDRPEFYADMAMAFLNDKDAAEKGEEKLWLYYKFFVEKENQ